MMNYAGTTDATQIIEESDGVTSTEIYCNDTNGGDEKTTNAEIQKLIDAWNVEIDARICSGHRRGDGSRRSQRDRGKRN